MTAWEITTRLQGIQPEEGFGHSVALSGNLLAVGAPYHHRQSSNNKTIAVGAVYIFVKTDGDIANETPAAAWR